MHGHRDAMFPQVPLRIAWVNAACHYIPAEHMLHLVRLLRQEHIPRMAGERIIKHRGHHTAHFAARVYFMSQRHSFCTCYKLVVQRLKTQLLRIFFFKNPTVNAAGRHNAKRD